MKHPILFAVIPTDLNSSLILDIDENITKIGTDQQLMKLPLADGAAFNTYHRQHEPLCIADTRVDLLKQIQEWSGSHERRIFWLNGMAGTGKSTVARTVASSFYDQKCLGASFFFSRGGGDLGHAARFITTLAYQLASLVPNLKSHVYEAIAGCNDITQQGLRNQWKQLVLNPLSQLNSSLSSLLTVVVVVDALDECEHKDDIRLILQLLVEAKDISNIRLKVFITSRPEVDIRLEFLDMPEIIHQDLILHDIPRSIVEHDIFIFLKYELCRIGKIRRLQDWPGEDSIKLLVQRSDCLFIYAKTACRFVDNPKFNPAERLPLVLKGNSTGRQSTVNLDHMYTQVLTYSLVKDECEEDRLELSKQFKHIVGSIVILFDVLSANALTNLLRIPFENVDTMLSLLHSLLSIPPDPDSFIRLLHPSFRDFLLDPGRCTDIQFRVDRDIVHRNLATSCLQLLFNTLKRDIFDLRMPGILLYDIYNNEKKHELPKHVQYACRYWVDHLELTEPSHRHEVGLHDDGLVHNFFQKHFLHWLEALSLMKKVSEGVLLITKLERMLEVSRSAPF